MKGEGLSDDQLPLDQFVTYRLSKTQGRLNAQAGRILQRVAGLTMAQWRIIFLIKSHGPASAAEFVRLSSTDKGLFSRNVKALIKKGMVSATADSKDQRVRILDLTEEGHRIYDKTIPHMRERQQKLMAAWTEDEQVAFYLALDKLEAAADTV